MELQSSPAQPRPRNRLARFSGYATGISWFLLFTFVLSDAVLGHASTHGDGAGILVCIGPLAIISALGLLAGVVTGHMAMAQVRRSGEEGAESARNGVLYGYLGLGYLVLAPLVNPLLAGIGLHLPNITDLFAGLR